MCGDSGFEGGGHEPVFKCIGHLLSSMNFCPLALSKEGTRAREENRVERCRVQQKRQRSRTESCSTFSSIPGETGSHESQTQISRWTPRSFS